MMTMASYNSIYTGSVPTAKRAFEKCISVHHYIIDYIMLVRRIPKRIHNTVGVY